MKRTENITSHLLNFTKNLRKITKITILNKLVKLESAAYTKINNKKCKTTDRSQKCNAKILIGLCMFTGR